MKYPKTAALLLSGLGLLGGIAGTVALQTHAQTTVAAPASAATASTPAAADATADAARPRGHAPIGGDGNVTAISGTTITMQEEADENGASYTIDASKATVTNNGASAALSDIKVGDKIFVQGAVTGTNVVATSVSLGHPGMGGPGGRGSQPPQPAQ
jgi:hypothetical protein